MRHLPRSTRLVIAVQYIRYRNARFFMSAFQKRYGDEHPVTLDWRARWVEANNALRAAQLHLATMSDEKQTRDGTREWMRIIAKYGEIKNSNF